jgi:hypothetical protein
MSASVSAKDAGALFKFLRYFGKKQGLLISLRDETELVNNGMAVKVLPYWKYWSIRQWIEQAPLQRRLPVCKQACGRRLALQPQCLQQKICVGLQRVPFPARQPLFKIVRPGFLPMSPAPFEAAHIFRH